MCIYPPRPDPPLWHRTPLGHCRVPHWTPCAVQQAPTRYLFYIRLHNDIKLHKFLRNEPWKEMAKIHSTRSWVTSSGSIFIPFRGRSSRVSDLTTHPIMISCLEFFAHRAGFSGRCIHSLPELSRGLFTVIYVGHTIPKSVQMPETTLMMQFPGCTLPRSNLANKSQSTFLM